MKTPDPKTQLREQIEAQMRDYIDRGGAVQAVARGASGRDNPATGTTFRAYSPRPREERTYVPEVIAAIEARRKQPKPRHESSRAKATTFTRKTIYDDFGEPIRWEWVER